jgi:hypothetical protein
MRKYDPHPIAAGPTIMKAYGIKTTIPFQGNPDFERMQLCKNYQNHNDPIYLAMKMTYMQNFQLRPMLER